MVVRIHHVGIATANIEDALQLYFNIFGCQPTKVLNVEKPGLSLRTAMLSLGSSHLQLIEPHVGPGIDELKARGEGTILEMALEVEDIEKFYEQMKALNIEPVNIMGEPISTKFLTASSGNRYFYLPQNKTRGTKVEIYQVVAEH